MPSTDTTEKGLEALIVHSLTSQTKYLQGDPKDYDREHAVDLNKLRDFLQATQPTIVEKLVIGEDGPNRQKFLNRLQGEIARRGAVDVLRKGVDHLAAKVQLFYGAPSRGNTKAADQNAANIFSI